MAILNKFFQADEEAKKTDEKSVEKPRAAKSKEVKAVDVKAAGTTKPRTRFAVIRPIVTEKSSLLMSQNQYVFEVAPGTNKIVVAQAIKELYGVKPLRIRIMNVPEKKRLRGRMIGVKIGWKKAIVVLPAGSTISVAEGA